MLLFLEILLFLIIPCIALWPYMTAAVGTLLSTVIYVTLLIIMTPLVLLFNRSIMRQSDRLYEQMKELEMKGNKDTYEYISLEKQLEESESELAQRGQSMFLILLLVVLILFLIKILKIIIGLY